MFLSFAFLEQSNVQAELKSNPMATELAPSEAAPSIDTERSLQDVRTLLASAPVPKWKLEPYNVGQSVSQAFTLDSTTNPLELVGLQHKKGTLNAQSSTSAQDLEFREAQPRDIVAQHELVANYPEEINTRVIEKNCTPCEHRALAVSNEIEPAALKSSNGIAQTGPNKFEIRKVSLGRHTLFQAIRSTRPDNISTVIQCMMAGRATSDLKPYIVIICGTESLRQNLSRVIKSFTWIPKNGLHCMVIVEIVAGLSASTLSPGEISGVIIGSIAISLAALSWLIAGRRKRPRSIIQASPRELFILQHS